MSADRKRGKARKEGGRDAGDTREPPVVVKRWWRKPLIQIVRSAGPTGGEASIASRERILEIQWPPGYLHWTIDTPIMGIY